MLEKLINKLPFKKTIVASALLFGLGGCGDTIINRPYDHSEKQDSNIDFNQEEIAPEVEDIFLNESSYCTQKKFFKDTDNDGYGDKQFPKWACEKPEGYVDNFLDCVDVPESCNEKYSGNEGAYDFCINNTNLIRPGALEICNSVDDDCDYKNNKDNDGDGLNDDGSGGIDEGLDCCELGDVKDVIYCPPYDFVFVIDNSGSMEDNDPKNIRYQGLFSFIDKMDEDDRGLVIPFGSEACVVDNESYMESPTYYPFTSNKGELGNNVEKAKTAPVGGGTAIGNAIMVYAIPSLTQSNFGKAVILLTDGKTNSDDSVQYLATNMSQKAISYNIRLYALGLGSKIDENYLKKLATPKGDFFHIQSAQQIPTIYNEIVKGLKFQEWKECSSNSAWVLNQNDCGF